MGCRIDRSRQWAVRCAHEASRHSENSYLTLTYRNEALPPGGSLEHRDFQLFMKRLRKRLEQPVRYYMCGEYGEKLGRPHYHCLLFGYRYPDLKRWKKNESGDWLYTSELLEEDWKLGFCSVGGVSFKSAAYVARYILKKQTGDQAQRHYINIDYETGECWNRKPEYNHMSRRPGIAWEWFQNFNKDVYPDDFCVIEGKRFKTPRYYDKLLKRLEGPEALEEIKAARFEAAKDREADQTPERLAVREEVQTRKLDLLKRGYECN